MPSLFSRVVNFKGSGDEEILNSPIPQLIKQQLSVDTAQYHQTSAYLDQLRSWWYFLDHPEIAPDNNLAERTLRLAVTKRKVSGGSRFRERFHDPANLLTVIQTCRRQGRSVIKFFDQAIKAMVNPAVQTPSLIP